MLSSARSGLKILTAAPYDPMQGGRNLLKTESFCEKGQPNVTPCNGAGDERSVRTEIVAKSGKDNHE